MCGARLTRQNSLSGEGDTMTDEINDGYELHEATEKKQSKRRWARVQRRELIAFVIVIGMLVVTAALIVVYLLI
jgi:ABC-type nickel/cobalt efflux system permease component RcnA